MENPIKIFLNMIKDDAERVLDEMQRRVFNEINDQVIERRIKEQQQREVEKVEQEDMLKYVSVNADCKKKKNECGCEYNSDECKLRFITSGCFDKGLKVKKEKEMEAK